MLLSVQDEQRRPLLTDLQVFVVAVGHVITAQQELHSAALQN